MKLYFRLLHEYLASCDVVSSDLLYLQRTKDHFLNSWPDYLQKGKPTVLYFFALRFMASMLHGYLSSVCR